MKRATWAALGLLYATPSAALAQTAAGAPASLVKTADAKDLEYFVGSWRVSARDPATGEVVTIDYQVEPIPGGRWLAGRGESADRSIAARDTWGIDPATGQIVRFVFDGSGAYGIVRAQGWTGDRLILTGDAQAKGGPTKVRETIKRNGRNRFEAVWEAMVDGAWKVYSIEVATRR